MRGCERCGARRALRLDADDNLSCAICGHVAYLPDAAKPSRTAETDILLGYRAQPDMAVSERVSAGKRDMAAARLRAG